MTAFQSKHLWNTSQRHVFYGDTVIHSLQHTILQFFLFDCRLNQKFDKKAGLHMGFQVLFHTRDLDQNKKQISKVVSFIFISRFLSKILMLHSDFQPIEFCIKHS